MKIFDELNKAKVSENEDKISKFWDEIDILNKSIESKDKDNNFVFYEGPPTANGMPGIHHVMSRLLKDTITKFKTMQGYRVVRKAGWDTHGLPVEIEVEKALGLNNKQEIENFGIKEFNLKCKESVFKNEKAFSLMTKKMGQFIDLDNPYITYDNDYIETEWWILKKMFDDGMIYEGHKILPYCSRCGTGLASHEVAQGYQEVPVDTVYVPLKLINEDAYLLIWTTTPWTLMANVAVAVNPNEEYALVLSKGNKFYLAKSLVAKIFKEDYEILETMSGTKLENKEYEQILPFVKVKKKSFYVTLADYVTMDDGTGIVHIAPAFGEDDYEVGRKYDLPVINPVSEEGKYTEGPWQDKFVIDADKDIISYLKEHDKLFKKERIVHNYPHCWRCKTPLLYYAKPSWYIEMTKIKDKLIENNNSVNWYPDYVGEKRFGNWLENLNDWAISRSRYWGTPLPIWTCDCGHIEAIGSRKELKERAIEDIDENIELHRPYVDDVHITCSKCGKKMNRVEEVIDCWFDSGSMPFSQYHYPFENKDIFKTQFPADFICEGIDQTRGWFYSLIAISTYLTGKSPYKNVLVNDLLLDKDGKKMSKSKGNTVDPFLLFEKHGADPLRWYLLYTSPVWNPTKFDIRGLKEVQSKFFNTYKNIYNFFVLYANTDKVDPRTFEVDVKDRTEIDKWLLSRYNSLVKNVTNELENYDLHKSVRLIQDFINEDLSNWYIRRNRRRFWASKLDVDKKAVYKTTYEVLEGLTRLVAPFIPFISEEMYQKLTKEESVHLSSFPTFKENLIDEKLEEKMDLIRDLISLGRFAREAEQLKVRQPLKEIIIDGKHEKVIGKSVSLIKEELNIKNVTFEKDLSKFMNVLIVPNFKVAGPIFGSKMKEFQQKLKEFSYNDYINLKNGEEMTLSFGDEKHIININLVDIKVDAKKGFNAQMENNNFVILNTSISEELKNEGLMREFISKIQQLRKNSGFEMMDRIDIKVSADTEFIEVLKNNEEYIKKETLADDMLYVDKINEEFDINDFQVGIEVVKK